MPGKNKTILSLLLSAILCLITAGNLFPQRDGKKNEETFQVTVFFEPSPGAIFYVIEWLENKLENKDAASPKGSIKDKVVESPIKRRLPDRFSYFRIRSAMKNNVYGPWSEIIKIDKPLNKLITKKKKTNTDANTMDTTNTLDTTTDENTNPDNPRSEKVFAEIIHPGGGIRRILIGNTLDLSKILKQDPLYYTLANITPGTEHTLKPVKRPLSRTKYENTPLKFTNPGMYEIEIFASPESNLQEKPLKRLVFWVDLYPPESRVEIWPPISFDRYGMWVGGQAKVLIKSWDKISQTEFIYFRIYEPEKKPGNYQLYDQKITPNTHISGKRGKYVLEFYGIDLAGNTEKTKSQTILFDAQGPSFSAVNYRGKRRITFTDDNYPLQLKVTKGGQTLLDGKYDNEQTIEINAGEEVSYEGTDLLGNQSSGIAK